MILRDMFKQLFNRNPTDTVGQEYARFMSLNDSVNLLTAADKQNYQNLFVRVCVDSLAENGAKLRPRVIRKADGQQLPATNKRLQQLLEFAPNEYMNSYEFLYKVITLWGNENNAFIYIRRDKAGNVTGLYPINHSGCEFLEKGGFLYVRFNFLTGFQMVVPYEELAHLRRFFGPSDLFGESNDITLSKQVGLLNTVNAGFAAAVNSARYLRGILKFNMNLKDDDLAANKQRFVNEYMALTNTGGVAALDTRADYQELKNNVITADNGQMKTIREDIMGYYHTNEAILQSKYDENGWAAYYESVLEPIAIRLSLELTRKIFTQREQALGNQIVFEANRLQYASTQSKINLLKELMPMGLMTINEGREVFNMAPVVGGDKRIMSLNYIDAELANDYQLAKKGGANNAD